MICSICKKPVIPEKGYFKTQLFGKIHLVHTGCVPKFHYSNEKVKEVTDWREQK